MIKVPQASKGDGVRTFAAIEHVGREAPLIVPSLFGTLITGAKGELRTIRFKVQEGSEAHARIVHGPSTLLSMNRPS